MQKKQLTALSILAIMPIISTVLAVDPEGGKRTAGRADFQDLVITKTVSGPKTPSLEENKQAIKAPDSDGEDNDCDDDSCETKSSRPSLEENKQAIKAPDLDEPKDNDCDDDSCENKSSKPSLEENKQAIKAPDADDENENEDDVENKSKAIDHNSSRSNRSSTSKGGQEEEEDKWIKILSLPDTDLEKIEDEEPEDEDKSLKQNRTLEKKKEWIKVLAVNVEKEDPEWIELLSVKNPEIKNPIVENLKSDKKTKDIKWSQARMVKTKDSQVFEVKGTEKKSLFWIFVVEMEVVAKVDITGKVVEVAKPWYSFLAW